MRFVKTSDIKAGMKVAKTVQRYNQSIPIVKEHVVLNDDMIAQIKKYNLYGIYIEDYSQTSLCWERINKNAQQMIGDQSFKDMSLEQKADVAEQMILDISLETPVALLLQHLYDMDSSVYEHSRRVAQLSLILKMQMTDDLEELGDLALAALLHDIGKIKIPTVILLKKEPLSEVEEETLKQHVMFAYQFVKKSPFISEKSKVAILQHHENYDGSGYPGRTKQNAISEMARILRITDAYDTIFFPKSNEMTHDTEYVLSYILKQSGKLFDPLLVNQFVEIAKNFRIVPTQHMLQDERLQEKIAN